jgi:hypothetical protein
LLSWSAKVRYPRVYTLTNGWSSGTAEYTLPVYVTPPLRPQAYRGVPNASYILSYDSAPQQWTTLPGWDMDMGGTAPVLRLETAPSDLTGRVVYYPTNGPVPTTLPTINTTIDDDDTTLILTGTPEIGDVGFVLADSEWIGYAGVSRGASTTTLSNLERGKYSTTAASHTSSGTVYWGVVVDDARMYRQLADQMRADLHALYLTDGAEHERANHERLMSFYQGQADKQLALYVGQPKDTRMLLTRSVIGRY